MYNRMKSKLVLFLFYELSYYTMGSQLLVLYIKLMLNDEAQAKVKHLNYYMCCLSHAQRPLE